MKVGLNLINLNAYNQNNNNKKIAFQAQGRVIYKGICWNQDLYEEVFRKSKPVFANLLDGHNIILREVEHKSSRNSGIVLNVLASRVRQNSLVDKIADRLKLLPRHKLSQNDFTEDKIPEIVTTESLEKLAAELQK